MRREEDLERFINIMYGLMNKHVFFSYDNLNFSFTKEGKVADVAICDDVLAFNFERSDDLCEVNLPNVENVESVEPEDCETESGVRITMSGGDVIEIGF